MRPFASFVAVGPRAERRPRAQVGRGARQHRAGQGRATEAARRRRRPGRKAGRQILRRGRGRGWNLAGCGQPSAGRGGDFWVETVWLMWVSGCGCVSSFLGGAATGLGLWWVGVGRGTVRCGLGGCTPALHLAARPAGGRPGAAAKAVTHVLVEVEWATIGFPARRAVSGVVRGCEVVRRSSTSILYSYLRPLTSSIVVSCAVHLSAWPRQQSWPWPHDICRGYCHVVELTDGRHSWRCPPASWNCTRVLVLLFRSCRQQQQTPGSRAE